MLASITLRPVEHKKHSRVYLASERFFDGCSTHMTGASNGYYIAA